MSVFSPDVLIIGGGVIGLATAWRIAREGLRVTLIDQGQIGREASWAGAGIIDRGSYARGDALALFRRRSVAMYPEFVREIEEVSGLSTEFITCGQIELITDDNQERAAQREIAAADGLRDAQGRAAAAALSVDDAARMLPLLAGGEFRGATLYRDVCQIRNPRYLAALQRACERAGVAMVENAAATGFVRDRERIVALDTRAGRFSARHFVLAAGAWAATIDAALGANMPVRPIRGQIVLLDHVPPPPPIVIGCGSRYLVIRRDGHVLIGSTEEDVGFDKRTTVAGIAGLLTFGRRLAPGLAGAAVLRTWAGLRPASADGKPYIGAVPGFEGLIAATGHFRSGLTLAPATAEAVCGLICGAEAESLGIGEFGVGRTQGLGAGGL